MANLTQSAAATTTGAVFGALVLGAITILTDGLDLVALPSILGGGALAGGAVGFGVDSFSQASSDPTASDGPDPVAILLMVIAGYYAYKLLKK